MAIGSVFWHLGCRGGDRPVSLSLGLLNELEYVYSTFA